MCIPNSTEALRQPHGNGAPGRHAKAWLLLTIGVALHVTDEALTGFLEFYNPLVRDIRARVWWFPMPTFTMEVWLAGLIALVVVLLLLTPVVRRGAPGTISASWVLSVIMFMNGLGHLAGSMYFRRWLPGATTAPLLLVASLHLMRQVRLRRTALRRS